MTGALTVARWTLKEAGRRRLLLAAAIASAAFVALFALAFSFLYGKAKQADDTSGLLTLFAVVSQTVLGLYAVQFLGAFLALFLSVGSISADADSGALHAMLARPIRRSAFLAGRWLGYAGLLTAYIVAMSVALFAVAGIIAGYHPIDPLRTVLLLVLESLLLLSVGMFGSTVLPTLANGVVLFGLFGLAWLAGVVEFIGNVLRNDPMVNLGVGVSLAFPSDALWRGASYFAQSPAFISDTTAGGGGIPFFGTAAPAGPMLAWAIAYPLLFLAAGLLAFRRKDL
ncbi:MAG TPA: ABC transporter permease subunit [Actinomycetes bacterium]|nr:ABC transporter permease subunit [Actinomycetes bacterium]